MAGLVFQIGFNKCATTALNKLFHRSGVPALHGTGKYWRDRDHPALAGRQVQHVIHDNIQAGRKAIETLEDFRAFFDMESVKDGHAIENFRHFAVLARDYPHARFILNTRAKQDWLLSRVRHNDGAYLARAMEATGYDEAGVLAIWSADFDRHHDMVLSYFAAEQDRLMVFDIDHTPVEDLAAFCRPEIKLWPRFWKRLRVTDEKAESNDWQTPDIAPEELDRAARFAA